MATSITGTPVTGESAGSYIIQADIENVFGTSNVQKWSQLDNDFDIADTTRITTAITYAEERVENRFRESRYALPFSPISNEIKEWCAKLAGIWLYQSRGQDDDNEEGNKLEQLRKNVEDAISMCLAGITKLNTGRHDEAAPTAPIFI